MSQTVALARPGGMKRTNIALLVIALAQLMVVLDVAIVNVALPSIQHALGFKPDGLEWVANAYAIAFGGLLLLGGRAGDRFGRRRVFLIGTVVFTAGSLLGGLAQTANQLIAARAFQGVGAAIMSPTALSLLADTFKEGRERNRALGLYSAVSAGGGALGLLLGGIITTYLSWRWILFVNIPIGALLIAAAPRVLPATSGVRRRLDLPGAVAVTAGASLLVYGLSRAAVHHLSDSVTAASLIAAGLLLVSFLLIEAVSKEPLMPLSIFRDRNRSGAYALSLAVGASLSGLLYLLTLYLQNVLGFSALRAGLAFLPTALGVGIGAGVTSRLIGRTGPRLPMAVGSLMAALALFWLTRIPLHAAYWSDVLGPLVLLALGLGQAFVATSTVVLAGVGGGETGLASALLNVGRQLGGSLGIAAMATVATTAVGTGFALGGFIALAGFVATILLVRRPKPAVPPRTALVTGASRGIGPHIARELAAGGYSLVLTARSEPELHAIAAELGARAVVADLTDPHDVERLARAAGPVDVLVNNAGGDPQREFDAMSWAENEAIFRLNVLAPMQLTHALLPGMLERGRGHVVNISSIAGRVGFPYTEAYAAAKDGLIGFTRVLRNDHAARGVSASAVVLGAIRDAGQGQRTADELGLKLPPMATAPAAAVGRAVADAIRKNRAEVVVMPGPGRLLKALLDLFPGLGSAMNTSTGSTRTMRRVVAHRARSRQEAA